MKQRDAQTEQMKQEWLAKNKPTIGTTMDLRKAKPTIVNEPTRS